MTQVDPITTEIIRNAFVSIAQDMNAALFRSAYTPVIYEGRDCAAALLDENGDVLAQAVGVPLFLGNLEVCVKLTAEIHGWDAFRPGDIFYMNDAYMQGTHLNDATIFAPMIPKKPTPVYAAAACPIPTATVTAPPIATNHHHHHRRRLTATVMVSPTTVTTARMILIPSRRT